MKAAYYSNYGDPGKVMTVKYIEKPEPKPDEILVKVMAATVNRTDEGIVTARYLVSRLYSGLFKPKKPVSGTDFAGQIEAVGAAVTGFKIGDRIFGFNDEGLSSHAEYLTIAQNKAIAKIPEYCSYAEAAASCEGFHYAYNFINKVKLIPGQKVLLNGATGAIGSAALQILQYFGAEITATANTQNLKLVKALGAKAVIDYTKSNFTEDYDYSNADEQKYDFIFDAVGKSTFTKCRPLLKKNGIYVSSELGPYASNIFFALFTPMLGKKKVIFPMPSDIRRSLKFATKLIDEQKFKPVIDRTYSLLHIIDAYTYVQTGQKDRKCNYRTAFNELALLTFTIV